MKRGLRGDSRGSLSNQISEMKNTNSVASMSALSVSAVSLDVPITAIRRFRSVLQTGTLHEIEKALRQFWLVIILVVNEILIQAALTHEPRIPSARPRGLVFLVV